MLKRKSRPIAEHEARGHTVRIYHEIRQTLRVSGVNLNFRTWATFPEFFPVMWAAMQPLAASEAFESAADGLRARAVDLAFTLPPLQVRAALGESQQYQLERALALYHYVNPKLLLFTVIVRRSLTRDQASAGASSHGELAARIPFGPPPAMPAMEMVDESPRDPRVRRIFSDIKKTLQLTSVNSDYRTLGLWPDYLEPAWAALKPIVRTEAYQAATATLARDVESAANRFSPPASIDLRRLEARGENTEALLDVTKRFERLLPPLVLNVALFARDQRRPREQLRESPFPIAAGAVDTRRRPQ